MLESIFYAPRLVADYVKTRGRHVSEVMTLNPECVTPKTSLEVAAAVEVIRDDIKGTLAKQSWVPKTCIHVSVTNAVVTLEGVIMSDEEHEAIRVTAENAIGVMDVEDHLIFVDPRSGMAFPVGG
jgi:osmotically-inducible protein OsmY